MDPTVLTGFPPLPAFLLLLVVFGFAPGFALRIIVMAFHRSDPRRRELRAELHAVPRFERPFWVFEQIEVAICEGLRDRIEWAATGRIIYRWRMPSGVERNRLHPTTFEIPSRSDRDAIGPGDSVKLMFEMSERWGTRRWGERMWVDVVEVKRRRIVGHLRNQPVGIPKLDFGDAIKFKRDHIIDITWADEPCELTDATT